MTQQIINIGDAPNDGTGDQLRISFDKCNLNFTELYDRSSSVSGFAEYRFDTATAPPPGSGYIRANNASIAAITVLYFHNVTNNGSDIKRVLTELPVGATLVIQDQGNNVNFGKFNITATPIDHGTYVEFPVTVADSGGTFFNNTKLLVAMSGGGGGGGSLAIGSTPITGGVNGNFLYDNAAIIGERTPTQATATLDAFTSALKGLVPASGGGTANFLRADGTWAAPTAPILPTQQIFTSGSGTYTTPAGCRRIEVTMVGGGAGGAGGNSGGLGTSGGNTTFGTLTANGATATTSVFYQAGTPGTATGGNINIVGGSGTDGMGGISGTYSAAGKGGSSIFGGAGGGGTNRAGSNAAANTGAGGGGGGGGLGLTGAGGGSSGGAVIHTISSPAATYSYAVGAGGTGGTGGASAFAGGNGAAGIITVKEFY